MLLINVYEILRGSSWGIILFRGSLTLFHIIKNRGEILGGPVELNIAYKHLIIITRFKIKNDASKNCYWCFYIINNLKFKNPVDNFTHSNKTEAYLPRISILIVNVTMYH